jgi:uncharacterized lipoprotein YddW (UPF0748 family)
MMRLKYLAVFIFCIILNLNSQNLQEFRAVKITNVDSDVMFSDHKIAEAMDYLADIGINTILVVVWNSNSADGDYTLYPSPVMEKYFGKRIHPSFVNRDPLQRIIIEAHRNGMEVLPWFEMGFSTSYSQNGGHIIKKYPHWALKDVNGKLVVKNGFDWMSAVNPEVQEFMRALAIEVIDQYDVDGIEYSDRIPAMPVEGGYDSVTVSVYRQEHNGTPPPAEINNAEWMRWRADKLSDFFKQVRDSIKSRNKNLIVSSSPSIYPWSFQEYLQDSKTWVLDGIADNVIPQLYRYNYADYTFELNNSLNNFPGFSDIYYAGMLIKSGSYIIEPGFLLKSIQANRSKQVNGEAFFFYEGLRANNNLLGDTLKTTWYAERALVPDRNGNIWRPEANILNENDSGVLITGEWTESDIAGFDNGILINADPNPASIQYQFDVPFSAWFDVFVYNVTGALAASNVPVSVYSLSDSMVFYLNQKDGTKAGWQSVGTTYLDPGMQTVVKISNSGLLSGEKLVADAAMIMINRKKSPDVIISNISENGVMQVNFPRGTELEQNYPNPFNPVTAIGYRLSAISDVDLSIFNLLGQKVKTLVSERQPAGNYKIEWNATGYASGVYIYRLKTGVRQDVKKMILIR